MIEVNHYGNGVFSFDNIIDIDQKDIDDLIFKIENNSAQNKSRRDTDGRLLNNGGYDVSVREEESSRIPLRFPNILFEGITEKELKTIRGLELAIYKAVVIYCRYFPSAMTSIRWNTLGYLIKYTPGQYIGPHSDSSIPYGIDGHTPLNLQPLHNTLTCTITLNDNFTGGSTAFRPFGIEAPSRAGRILVYPSNFSGCHEISPVTTGTRYAYLSWYCHGDLSIMNPITPMDESCSDISLFRSMSYFNLKQFIQDVNVTYQDFVPLGRLSENPETRTFPYPK